jgi:hypothetical protein
MLKGIHLQMVVGIAVNNRPSGYHLGVEHGMLADQAHKVAAVAIGPVEHWSDAKCSINTQ